MQFSKIAGAAVLAGVAFAGGAIYATNKLIKYALTHDIDIAVVEADGAEPCEPDTESEPAHVKDNEKASCENIQPETEKPSAEDVPAAVEQEVEQTTAEHTEESPAENGKENSKAAKKSEHKHNKKEHNA